MPEFDTHELAWAAGLFDGEGTTYFQVNRQRLAARVWGSAKLQIGQKDRGVLDRFRKAVGVGTVGGPYTSNGRSHFVYRVSRWRDVQHVVALLWSRLSSIKKEQAYEALKRHKEQRNTRTYPAQITRRTSHA